MFLGIGLAGYIVKHVSFKFYHVKHATGGFMVLTELTCSQGTLQVCGPELEQRLLGTDKRRRFLRNTSFHRIQ